ncbi:glycosyltransferase [Gallibacterium anatis]|uniref:glycosyltransferase n=1 Tax=Gallibacterium anatis TaxID=750 RepID=UPI0030066F78
MKNKFKIYYTIINIIKLINDNPELIRRCVYTVKYNGIKATINKIKKKIYSTTPKLTEKNHIDLDKIRTYFLSNQKIPTLKIDQPIDIIIPVYNGFDYLLPLFNSIKNNTSIPYRLLVCNDKSTDKRVSPFLRSIKESYNIDFLLIENNENLGFIKTVNKLVELTENHFVLLNTDIEVPPYWLERLMYPIFTMENIASTTPFTNSGTICSFPKYLEDNKILLDLEVNQVDSYFRTVNFENTYIEIPTAIGFCMGVNKELVKKIGMFDEIYGKGYCEENDWSQRAIVSGYKNIHVTNLFVYHKHGGSFPSLEKQKLQERNYNILIERYRNYPNDVNLLIERNELYNLRKMLEARITLSKDKENFLNGYYRHINIYYIGYLSSTIGVGRASKGYIHLLEEMGFNVIKFDLNDHSWKNQVINNLLSNPPLFIINHYNAPETLFIEKEFFEICKYFSCVIGIWAWESDNPILAFRKASKNLHSVWGISNYMMKALKDVQCHKGVLQHIVDEDEVESKTIQKDLKKIREEYKFIAGYIFDLNSYYFRKNPEGVIKCFKDAFKNKDDACLILKISGINNNIKDYNKILDIINNDSRIKVFTSFWENTEINYFYEIIDVYLALFRSEGFGLTIAEAMVSNTPVICTNYSGVQDYIGNSILKVDFSMIEIPDNWGPYEKGWLWADPNISEATNYLLKLYYDSNLRKKYGREGYLTVKNVLSYKSTEKKLLSLLKESLNSTQLN